MTVRCQRYVSNAPRRFSLRSACDRRHSPG